MRAIAHPPQECDGRPARRQCERANGPVGTDAVGTIDHIAVACELIDACHAFEESTNGTVVEHVVVGPSAPQVDSVRVNLHVCRYECLHSMA